LGQNLGKNRISQDVYGRMSGKLNDSFEGFASYVDAVIWVNIENVNAAKSS